jgi:ligand-binding sensor domain-containing protein
MTKRLLFFIALLLCNGAAELSATNSDWQFLPSVHSVRELIYQDGAFWGATNSGLFRFDHQAESFQFYNTVDNLSSVDISAMVLDDRGNLILGMKNAYLDIFNLTTHQVIRIPDLRLNEDIFSIYALFSYGGDIFIGTDVGVHRLVYFDDLDKYLIQNTYENLGSFTPQRTAVYAIEVYEQGLWVGTVEGLARGDLNAPYLESPESWTNYTTSQGLSSDSVSALAIYQDTLYVATPLTGLNRLAGTVFEPLNVSFTTGITFMEAHQDTLYMGRPYGIFNWSGGQVGAYGSGNARGRCLEFDADSLLWAGFQTIRTSSGVSRIGGLKRWNSDHWTTFTPEGPLAIFVDDILVEEDGSLWVCGKQDLGYNNGCLSHFDGSHWINLGHHSEDTLISNSASPDSFFWYQPRRMVRDNAGNLWVGSDGRGAAWFEFTGDTVLAKGYYSASSGHLFNIPLVNSHYCVVRDLLTDDWGNVWICNSEADQVLGESIAIVPSDFINGVQPTPPWHYLTVMNDFGTAPVPNASYYIDRVVEDSYGRKWFGANNNKGSGIKILDDGASPISPLDDVWTTLADPPSTSITALAVDRDGIVWVGTPEGVQYFYPEENPDYLNGIDVYGFPIGSDIRTIAVDPQNNKWFGTTSGVCVLGADNFTWLNAYTDLEGNYPSPLPSDAVLSIAFNARSGDAYIGTESGLAVLATPYKQMGQTVSYLSIVQPNPFVVGDGEDTRLIIDPMGLSETSELKIFSTTGYLVRHLVGTEITLGWDGRNTRGELVGSGVYLLLAYAPDGSAQTGKVAVIHH